MQSRRRSIWPVAFCGRLADELFPSRRTESVDHRRLRFGRRPARLHCSGRSARSELCRDSMRTAIPPPSPVACPSATWTPTIPTAVRFTTASPPTCASASAATTNSSRLIPGRTRSTIPPTCNRRSRRRTVIFQQRIVPLRCLTSAIASSSAAFTRAGRLSGNGFASRFFSNWTFAPLIEVRVGTAIQHHHRQRRQPAAVVAHGPAQYDGQSGLHGGRLHACIEVFSDRHVSGTLPAAVRFRRRAPSLLRLDGNLGRNAGIAPWTVFNDLRVARRIYFGERFSMDLIADMFNIANKYNVAAVSPLFTNAGQATRRMIRGSSSLR